MQHWAECRLWRNCAAVNSSFESSIPYDQEEACVVLRINGQALPSEQPSLKHSYPALFPCFLILALRIQCMEDISSNSLWNYLYWTLKGSTETFGLKADRKTTPMPGFRVQKPHRACGEWKSGRGFHKSLNRKAQYYCQEKKKNLSK